MVFALCKFSEKNAKIKYYLSIKSQKCHTFSQSSSSTNWSIPKSDTMLNWGSVALSGILQIFHLELDDCTLGHKYSYLYCTADTEDTEDICTATYLYCTADTEDIFQGTNLHITEDTGHTSLL